MNEQPQTLSALAFEEVAPEIRLDIYRGEEWITSFAGDVREGLSSNPPYLQPKYFYDQRGSELFDRICELPEYYPTRTERSILETCGADIVDAARATALIELGSGSSEKTEFLLRPLLASLGEALYVPIDFSEYAVREAAVRLIGEYPGLRVHGVIGDFEKHLGGIPESEARLFAFLGGTIGNFESERMSWFLRRLAFLAQPGDRFLIGIDLQKDVAELEAAYNDSAGITAEFNKNVLASINANLGGNFDLSAWEHVAFYDFEKNWIEMRLRARETQVVRISAIDTTLDFIAGDEIRTEISRKFTKEGFTAELESGGLVLDQWFTDPQERFALALAAPA